MFVGDRMMALTSLGGAAAVFPACTATTMRPHALRTRMMRAHCGLRPQCAVNLDRNLKPKLAIMRQCTSVTDRRTDRQTDTDIVT